MRNQNIEIREVETFEEMDECLELQRRVFSFSDIDVSPRRHLVVTKQSGGFTLGAYDGKKIVGLTITVPSFTGHKRAFYSHMAAVDPDYQSFGIGAAMKWAQRERASSVGVNYIKWTFQPVQARNAFFNLEKLGAVIKQYVPNFYGTGFTTIGAKADLESDRVYAEWELDSEKTLAFSKNEKFTEAGDVVRTIEIPSGWNELLESDIKKAEQEQERIKREFQEAFAAGLICKGFQRDTEHPKYLFYKS
ncbi:MAG: GNAT family N-acetyltransferase [Pyrinomonadaceae bacterium]|nr:GNAT family N-acetyltransferase [Pyrinomonadaceae bacterium]